MVTKGAEFMLILLITSNKNKRSIGLIITALQMQFNKNTRWYETLTKMIQNNKNHKKFMVDDGKYFNTTNEKK